MDTNNCCYRDNPADYCSCKGWANLSFWQVLLPDKSAVFKGIKFLDFDNFLDSPASCICLFVCPNWNFSKKGI